MRPGAPTQLIKPVRMMIIGFVALITLLAAVAPAAGAELVDAEDLTSDSPIVDVGPLDLTLVLDWTARAHVDCDADDPVRVEADNNTDDTIAAVNVWVNGTQVEFAILGPQSTLERNYPVAENEVAHVVVEMLGDEVLNKELAVDCLAADPWFDFISNCDVGQAWVELGNDGPDNATMGIHYDDLPYAGGVIAAGHSTVQPLAVEPNEFVGFAIEVDGEPIYSDGYLFDCPVEEESPEDEVDPEPATDHNLDEAGSGSAVATPTPDPDQSGVEPPNLESDDELAIAAGLEVAAEPTSTGVMIGLLLSLGLAAVVGAGAALMLRR